jgi:hypothetical protein
VPERVLPGDHGEPVDRGGIAFHQHDPAQRGQAVPNLEHLGQEVVVLHDRDRCI